MSLTDAQRRIVAEFRDRFETALRGDTRFNGVSREDRPDGSTLSTRFAINDSVWMELTVRPLLPQVRVGILTSDRWKSEDWEEKIEESGDTMSEYIGMGMNEAGLDWEEPPVEHYRADLKYFYFATPLDLASLDQLEDPTTTDRLRRMFDGYHHAFAHHLG